MKIPKTVRVTERKLGRHKALGLCIHGKIPHIEIDPTQNSKERLDTILHETFHAVFPTHTEKETTLLAQRFASILWADKWRRIYN
jgi:hypothetical protein